MRLLSRSSGLDVGHRREILDTCYPTAFWNHAVSLGAATPPKINLQSATGCRHRGFGFCYSAKASEANFKGCDTTDLVSFNVCRHANGRELADKKYTKGYLVFIFHPGLNGAASHDLLSIKIFRLFSPLLTASCKKLSKTLKQGGHENKHLTGGVAINLGEVSVRCSCPF